jgi:uncharacterized glyoxalase superfamily protein PhnB
MPVKAAKHVPDGMNTVTTQLYFNGNCKQAIEFYKRAFGASVIGNIAYSSDESAIVKATILIGDTHLFLSDAWPDSFASDPNSHVSASLFIYVGNCDVMYNQAVTAGCRIINEMTDAFWGDRIGNVKDPFGHYWSIASYKWILTEEEILKNQEEWMKALI